MLGRNDQELVQLEARLEAKIARMTAPVGGSPQPELAQRVEQLERRLDNLVALLVGTLGIPIEPLNESEAP